jgi:hypothetical protein
MEQNNVRESYMPSMYIYTVFKYCVSFVQSWTAALVSLSAAEPDWQVDSPRQAHPCMAI